MNLGPEIGVASTKSFTGQMLSLLLLAHYIECPTLNNSYLDDLPNNIEYLINTFSEQIKTRCQTLKDAKSILVMGRHFNYPIAMEGALKLKEITYIHSEGFSASEMKHGVIALIDKETPIFYIIPNDSIYKKNKNNLEELKARNANIIYIGDTIKSSKPLKDYMYSFYNVILLQLYSYYIGIAKGNNVDKPRNLAKSVTVE